MNPKKPRDFCKYCYTELERIDQIYCNTQCQHDYAWKVRKLKLELDGKFPPSNKVARRYLIERDGSKCLICFRKEWDGKTMPLVLDHIDGNSDNWNISNFRMICPNCDTFTPFYKGRNKGNGRFKRKQRYKNGLSY